MSYVLFTIAGLCALFSVLLFTGTAWSGFAQRVYISFLGTSASAGLAIGLYYLKREHDRDDAEKKADADAQVRYRDEWLTHLRKARQAILDDAGMKVVERFRIMALALQTTANDYHYTFTDPALAKFCKDISEIARDITAIPNSEVYGLVNGMRAYTQVVTLAPLVLSKYVATGQASDLTTFKSQVQTDFYSDQDGKGATTGQPDGESI